MPRSGRRGREGYNSLEEKHLPSGETIQPLRPSQTQERERRLSFKELVVGDHTARSLQVEPSFAGHRELCLSVEFLESGEGETFERRPVVRIGREPSCLEGNAFMLTVLSDVAGSPVGPGLGGFHSRDSRDIFRQCTLRKAIGMRGKRKHILKVHECKKQPQRDRREDDMYNT